MKVLLIEDTEEKSNNVIEFLIDKFSLNANDITLKKSLSEFVEALNSEKFDAIITDLMLPITSGGTPQDVSSDICSLLKRNALNKTAAPIALTGYESIALTRQSEFQGLGVALVQYDNTDDTWKNVIEASLARVRCKPTCDFIIVCALESERAGFLQTNIVVSEHKKHYGFDAELVTLGKLQGLCICLPNMGLVSASVITSRLIEVFEPKLICMTGICGGYKKNTELGQLLIADPCWEYQSGKVGKDNFQIAPYQVALSEDIRLSVKEILKDKDAIKKIFAGLDIGKHLPKTPKPKIAPFISGSAVIANGPRIEELAMSQHRKMAGLDMEVYGLYRAAKLASYIPQFFACKTVVDLADEDKGDDLHEIGSVISARLATEVISRVLS